MTVPLVFTAEQVAVDRALAVVMSFLVATVGDDGIDESGEILFDVVEELSRGVQGAKTDEQYEQAREAIERVVVILASLISGLLEHTTIGDNKFEVFAGLAALYHGGVDE